jgi:hypothetical protein
VRAVKTIPNLSYADLHRALTSLGYVRREVERDGRRGVVYDFPAERDALILLPLKPLADPVRAIDLLVVQRTVEGFGVIEGKDFDLLLSRVTGGGVAARVG